MYHPFRKKLLGPFQRVRWIRDLNVASGCIHVRRYALFQPSLVFQIFLKVLPIVCKDAYELNKNRNCKTQNAKYSTYVLELPLVGLFAMDNVDVTDEGDEQGVPTYVQTAHSDDFNQYVWPPTTEIINFDDFIGE